MAKAWLNTRAGDLRDTALLGYNIHRDDPNGQDIFNVNRLLKGGMGTSFSLRKYFHFYGTVPGASTFWATCDDQTILKVDAYDYGDESFGAPVLPLLIENVVVAVEQAMTIGGAANTPSVGVLVMQYSSKYDMGRPVITVPPDTSLGAKFPTSGWSGGEISTYEPRLTGMAGATAAPGALGLVPADQADFSGYSSKGRYGRDAIHGGKLFWGSADVFDHLKISVSVTGSNETNAKFYSYLSVFLTGWILPTYEL